ncbi:hypothetical protein ACFL12_05630 [Pseudomonadota bacterium]
MEWILVLIALESASPVAIQGGVYDTMSECFTVREYVMDNEQGASPAQAVCIRAIDGEPVKMTQVWD